MKILFVIDTNDPNNGVSVSAHRYAEELRRRGHEVRFMCTGDAGENGYTLEKYRLPVFDELITKQGMTFARADHAIIESAVKWADVVHFYMPFGMSARTADVAKAMGKPMTAAFHVQAQNVSYSAHMGKVEPFNALIYTHFRNTFFNKFDHIHCPSEFIAGELRHHHYKAKLHVISNGVQPQFVYRKLPKPDEWADKFVILMIGRMSGEKRQDVLIDAVDRSKYRDRIQLELAGQGPLRDKLLRRGADLPNPVHIDFYSQDDLRDLIAKCDLYVHAADAEIEAMSCMEAFSSGLVPIIANSPKSATPQFALDDRSLFRAGDPDDLARKIDWWIEHPTERAEMEKKYSELGKKYAIASCVDKFEEMLREAMEGRR